ncbi:hypothetical protein PPERSA_10365 [Pseudocohnilembus persalinus]|uniref:60S ribosomal protein L18a n=1 Tax=Pseudocohnilembus persalinus TaxID=266149 RepID=A0A0V0QNM1_PSEPJ|nr:hypothetical protein PPERSA_10365 [Pseudocohnilembus persalinus]|eukprot:KRX03681.1 hypothetical protein PPERSA_10365 [Pseudocohnilembus persalinus]
MVKQTRAAQEPVDQTLQQKIRTYLVSARRLPSEQEPNPKVIQMRVFGRNQVCAQTKFWYQMRKLNKLKKAAGEIISVQEIYERNTSSVKTYGIVLKYQSRTAMHNMYKEYRDVSLNGAMSQLFAEMAGNHRADPNTIHIIRTVVVTAAEDIKRAKSNQYRDSSIKFPIVKTLPRASEKRFKSTFKANRPRLFQA